MQLKGGHKMYINLLGFPVHILHLDLRLFLGWLPVKAVNCGCHAALAAMHQHSLRLRFLTKNLTLQVCSVTTTMHALLSTGRVLGYLCTHGSICNVTMTCMDNHPVCMPVP